MKANELRIGNYVKRYSNIMEVAGTGKETADLILRQPDTGVNWRMLYEDFEPIPLTEEWLHKFRVEREPQITYSWKFSPAGEVYHTKCEYVHQLQNLYFALTGKELIIIDSETVTP